MLTLKGRVEFDWNVQSSLASVTPHTPVRRYVKLLIKERLFKKSERTEAEAFAIARLPHRAVSLRSAIRLPIKIKRHVSPLTERPVSVRDIRKLYSQFLTLRLVDSWVSVPLPQPWQPAIGEAGAHYLIIDHIMAALNSPRGP